MTTTKIINKEIEDLKSKRKELHIKEREMLQEFEETDFYKEKMKKIDELRKEITKVGKLINKMRIKIYAEYLLPSDDDYQSASLSKTWGINIRPEVIEAIKKTFRFKDLKNSNIETIVNKMISHDMNKNKELNDLKIKRDNLVDREDKLETERFEKERELIKEIRNEIYSYSTQIEDKQKELVRLKIELKENVDKKDLEIPYIKKRILEEYRDDCVSKWKEVLKNLK